MENLECLGCRNKLKLWLIERKDYKVEYDTYEAAIVVAENENVARNIHPSGKGFLDDLEAGSSHIDPYSDWVVFDNVKATLIGLAAWGSKRGVLLSSFHAG